MAENISLRVGRLISGTANMLVDAVENMAPDIVMEEAIREVDRAIAEVRAELGKLISSRHMATQRLASENQKHQELSEKVRIGLQEGRDDLAETAVSQILDIEAQIPVLEGTVADTKSAEQELEGYISALQGRKREMKEELRQYREAASAAAAATGSTGSGNGKSAGPGGVETSVNRAEEAFSRALEGAAGIGTGTQAPGPADAAKMAELDDLARQNRIKERLQAFKSNG